MTKQEVKNFRSDFQKAVIQLEKQYGVNISLGAIRFDEIGLSAKMKAEKGEKIVPVTKDAFEVGEIVSINHKSVPINDQFKIIKINNKNINVQKVNLNSGEIGGIIRVSPSLLIKR